MDSFKQKVYELIGSDEVGVMNDCDFIQKIVLAHIVKPFYERLFISDEFMNLMAENGTPLLYGSEDYLSDLLFELAMQRISHGGVSHGNYNTGRDFRPFRDYFATSDELQPLNIACWNFIRKQAKNVVMICRGNHMKKILFGILDNISLNGKVGSSLVLKDLKAKDVFDKTFSLTEDLFDVQTLYLHFATPEGVIKYKNWFRKNWSQIDKNDLISRLNLEGTENVQRRKLNALIFS